MTEQAYLPAMGVRWLLPFYDPFCRLAGVRRVHAQLLERADPQPGQRVLDVGCGTGTLLGALVRRSPTVEAIGIDPDAASLRRARAKAARAGLQISFERAYAGRLPLPDGSVDRVLSSLMLHHLDDDERGRALREVRRVLRPGGQLHVVDIAGGHGRHPRLAAVQPERVIAAMAAAGLSDPAVDGHGRVRFGRVAFYRAGR
ncbi:class I SAM-dependent methyltransferase [Dactylosporangium aurantiacum]|uniref:Class I SAM-dependent methyltransferase n=1 Tax=Dactylosporangium aurantiacum TaxID=35754 RepID=A0A9Q9IMU5_9ACTN|nr:class I SAM-dependent methyltransferase [Dactylosporangium aurantiacum]MDG6103713.1 class I SAM-dependent methyltransferase [Dactylosporangium aurantiacum]UWZ59069.1 class I SAM-dependent methyltransferase [Dactylosporangium aurantiacum]